MNGEARELGATAGRTLIAYLPRRSGPDRSQAGLRRGRVTVRAPCSSTARRCWPASQRGEVAGRSVTTIEGLAGPPAAPGSAGAGRGTGVPVRVLHAGHRAARRGAAGRRSRPGRRQDRRGSWTPACAGAAATRGSPARCPGRRALMREATGRRARTGRSAPAARLPGPARGAVGPVGSRGSGNWFGVLGDGLVVVWPPPTRRGAWRGGRLAARRAVRAW